MRHATLFTHETRLTIHSDAQVRIVQKKQRENEDSK